MPVALTTKKTPEYRLATMTLKGPWPGDKEIRAEFEKLHAWAKAKGVKTGKWFFTELGQDEPQASKRRYEVGIEVRSKGPLRGGKGVSMKSLPAATVASVTFDPDQVSPDVVYYAMMGWLEWGDKKKVYRASGPFREVYTGNPWSSKSAWARTQVQVPLRKK